MVDVQLFNRICSQSELGELKGVPAPVSGGLMHKMYSLETNKGKFAIKMLNPQIMKRSGAMTNYVNAERIANVISQQLPVVPAVNIHGGFIQKIDRQFYLVFNWADGKTLNLTDITISHSEIIGSILAEIHEINFSELRIKEELKSNDHSIDWQYYLQKGQQDCAAWVDLLAEVVDELDEWCLSATRANKLLSENLVISHRDLDPKNVLWNEHNPVLIDWESAGYINPMYDLIDTALYWSKAEAGNVDKEKFLSFINGYKKKRGEIQADWTMVLATGFLGKLDWLEYNLKRSLWIECTDEEEQKLGTSQVIETIKEIKDYAEKTLLVADWLERKN